MSMEGDKPAPEKLALEGPSCPPSISLVGGLAAQSLGMRCHDDGPALEELFTLIQEPSVRNQNLVLVGTGLAMLDQQKTPLRLRQIRSLRG